MGYWEYFPIAEQFHTPIVVTGFEPLDLVHGIFKLVSMLENNQAGVENAYARIVTTEGNQPSQTVIRQVFEDCDQKWRGIGVIPGSGWCLRDKYTYFDAAKRFQVENISPSESQLCIAGQILQGLKKPLECAAFAVQCTPENPLGATMVSSEGACSAYYKYARPDTLPH
jgi:hydrogenase expression/formation protein HypD